MTTLTTSSPATASGRVKSVETGARMALATLAAVLAVACVLRVLTLASPPARAEMVTTIPGEVVAMTADGGSEDVLYVLDNRAERLMVYKQTQSGLQLFAAEKLPELFNRARLTAPQ